MQTGAEFGAPKEGRRDEHLQAGDAPHDPLAAGRKGKVPAEDVDAIAEECDCDQEYLSDAAHMGKAIVGQAGEGPLLRTTADPGKGHYVAGPGRPQVVDEVKGSHVIWFACDIARCDQNVGRRRGDVELDWDGDVGGFVKPAEVGGNGAEDDRNGGKLDCRDG